MPILFSIQTLPSELFYNLEKRGVRPIRVIRGNKSYRMLMKGKLPKFKNYAFIIFGVNTFFEVKNFINRTPIILDTIVTFSKMKINLPRNVFLIDGKLIKEGYIIFRDVNYDKLVGIIEKPFDGNKIEVFFELKKARNFGVGSNLSSALNSFLITIPESAYELFLKGLANYVLTKDPSHVNQIVDEERLVSEHNKQEFETLINIVEQLKEYFDFLNPNIKKDKKEITRFRNLCSKNQDLGGNIRRLRWLVRYFADV